jgi:hypothetical protein
VLTGNGSPAVEKQLAIFNAVGFPATEFTRAEIAKEITLRYEDPKNVRLPLVGLLPGVKAMLRGRSQAEVDARLQDFRKAEAAATEPAARKMILCLTPNKNEESGQLAACG